MLYITTRGKQDAFTAYRTARQDRGPDGGFFVPMQMPVFNQKDILKLGKNSFGQNVADVLNLFFGTKISCWNVDVVVGRRIFNTNIIGHRTLMGQLWDDLKGDFNVVLRSLAHLVSPELADEDPIPNWLEMGIRIAVVFAVFGELLSEGQISAERGVDVAVATGSFAMPMALWYARQMGLPIRSIICGCNENGNAWDLIHRGAVDTGALSVQTTTPEGDYALAPNLERLIYAVLGHEQALRYWWTCTEGRSYVLSELDTEAISKGNFAAVVSMDRIATIISSVYRTNRYILEPYGALAYGALSDYRARTGAVGQALVLTEKSPACAADLVAKYLHISPEEITQLLSEV